MGKVAVESIPLSINVDFLKHAVKLYMVPDEFSPFVLPLESSIHGVGSNQVGVYLQFLLVGLRFPM